MNEQRIPGDAALGSFGVEPIVPPRLDDYTLQVAGALAARILAELRMGDRRAGEVMRAIAAVIEAGTPGRFVCFSIPWTGALIVTDADGRAYPRAAARRHKAKPIALDVDGLLSTARDVVRIEVDGGKEANAA